MKTAMDMNILPHESHYTSEKFLDGVRWKFCCAAARALAQTFRKRFLELAKGFEPPTL
jgi:hypothetical protein